MNRGWTGIAPVVLLAVTTLAQGTAEKRPVPRTHAAPTVRVLDQQVPDVRFRDTALEQVVEWLADLTQLNISVRWNILKDAGVNRDAPISVEARNLRLAQVLWLIMNEAGGVDAKLAYRVSGNLLVLSTADDLNKETITKVYDVADLLINLPHASRQSNMDITQGLGRSSGGSGIFVVASQDTDASNPPEEQTEQMQALIELIQETVEPNTWRVNGGTGSIAIFGRLLVVRNTIAVHQILGGYISTDDVGDR